MAKKRQKRYVSKEEAQILKEQFTKEIVTLKEKLKMIQEKYVEVGSNQKKVSLKKLEHLAKEERHIESLIQKRTIDISHLDSLTYVKKNAFEKILDLYRNLNYKNQKIICGLLLLLPWFIGFCLFFAKPMITTIIWSFNEVTTQAGSVSLKFIKFQNYKNLFTKTMLGNKTFLEVIYVSINEMLINVPIIFIFSLLVAVVLNTKFRGHQFFKAIFFIPVVYNATAISSALNGAFGGHMSSSMDEMSSLLSGFSSYLLNLGLGEGLIKFLISAIDRIFTIVNKSGIQILIFIAALQSIPRHLYEAAKVEGATTYECFWKITFPMVSPMFLPIIIYSMVDSFASSSLINYMTVNSGGAKMPYGMASTIAIIYFGVNLVLIGIIFAILKKVVYNHD